MDADQRSRARFGAGDPLRAIAAFGVLFGHTFSYALIGTGHMDLIGKDAPGMGFLKWPVAAGPELVFLFFTLSAYLIGRPFIRSFVEGSAFPSPVRYLKHRFLRIVPAYWVVLTLCLLLIAVPSKPFGPVAEAYLFLLDWYQSPIEGTMAQAWTLRVEVRFYLALPIFAALLVWLARRAGPRLGRSARCWIVIVLSAAWGVGTILATGGVNPFTNGAGLLHTAFAFAPGLMLAGIELLPFKASSLRRPAIAYTAVAAVLIAGSLWLYPWTKVLLGDVQSFRFRELILLTMIFGGLLVWQWSGRATWRVLDNPVMRWFGSRSYGIYLLHLLVLNKTFEYLTWGDGYRRAFAVLLPATVILTGLAAELLYRLVERPALSLKDVPLRSWFRRPGAEGTRSR